MPSDERQGNRQDNHQGNCEAATFAATTGTLAVAAIFVTGGRRCASR
ncbi:MULTISPECIES: hypothetical protein [Halomonadaceae]|nr:MULTISPECIES: hypothetical protein [Halomonas]